MVRRNGLLDGTKKWKPIWYEAMEGCMVRRNGLLDGTKKWIAIWYEEMDFLFWDYTLT